MARGRGPPSASAVTDLPADVLRHVMALAPQATRVACMTACKTLSRAALALGAWSAVTFGSLDATAVDFLDRHRCTEVRIVTCCPDDVEWFFDHLAERGIACITHLDVRVHSALRLPRGFLAAISRHSTLVSLEVQVVDMVEPCDVVFPRTSNLLDLETLRIREVCAFDDASPDTCADDPEIFKQLSVLFLGSQSRFPSLRTLVLDVAVSDAVAGLRHMPRLRLFAYAHEDDDDSEETYEDADFEGLRLDRLELSVTSAVDYPRLCTQLVALTADTVVLELHDDHADLRYLARLDVRRLVLRMHEARAHIRVDYPNLMSGRLRKLEVQVAPGWLEDGHAGNGPVVMMECVPSVAEAMERLHTTGFLDLHPLTRLLLSPV